MPNPRRPLILLFAAPESSPSILYGLYDVLYSAGVVYPDMTIGAPGPEALDVRIVASGGEPFRCFGNVLIEPDSAISQACRADAVVVCDFYTPINARPAGKYHREITWLRQIYDTGALICAVCSGTVLLAEAGLLDGRSATAHWAYRDLFRRCYPKVRLQNELALCLSAEADGVVTAGGATSWQDLAIYLLARFCGQRQAVETAKIFLISGHSEGQLPYAVLPRPADATDGVISACQSWIAANYARHNPVELMIARSGLSPRTFARRFRAATSYAPIDYVQALRVEEAKQMLETDGAGLDEIGAAVGYEDPASFRRVFKRKAGLTPAAYRRRFCAIGQIGRSAGRTLKARRS
jgi:transcriptional regulator GlxA family with amidase domain